VIRHSCRFFLNRVDNPLKSSMTVSDEGGSGTAMDLLRLAVAPVARDEEPRFRALMDAHHYRGAPSKIGQTVWYAVDDGSGEWIGWSRREPFGRLHRIANNVRLLLRGRRPNLGSRFLALCARRISADWQARHHHPLRLLETFVDPARFHGTVYRAATASIPCWRSAPPPRSAGRRDGRRSTHGSRASAGDAGPLPVPQDRRCVPSARRLLHPQHQDPGRSRPACPGRRPLLPGAWVGPGCGHRRRRQDALRRGRRCGAPDACARGQHPWRLRPAGSKKTVLTDDDGEKATNEIGVFIPTLDRVPDIAGRTVTADALLTQTTIAAYRHGRGARFLCAAKGNPKNRLKVIKGHFAAQSPSSPRAVPETGGLRDPLTAAAARADRAARDARHVTPPGHSGFQVDRTGLAAPGGQSPFPQSRAGRGKQGQVRELPPKLPNPVPDQLPTRKTVSSRTAEKKSAVKML